jgi:hypothetical protein
LLGLNQAAMVEVRGKARRNAFAAILLAVLLVTIPLVATGQRISQDVLTEIRSKAAAEEWVQGSEYEVRLVRVAGDSVTISVLGEKDMPPFADLVTAVHESVGRMVVVNLEVVPTQTLSSAASTP